MIRCSCGRKPIQRMLGPWCTYCHKTVRRAPTTTRRCLDCGVELEKPSKGRYPERCEKHRIARILAQKRDYWQQNYAQRRQA